MNSFETFVKLHQGTVPFVLGNIWDVNSARIFEANGYKAIGTSSHAVAKSLGYEDGEKMPFDDLFRLAKRVASVVRVPFTVDIEGGYSRTADGIIENIKKLHDAGVVGINLEDTIAGNTRQLQGISQFQNIISTIAENISRNNLKIFLNIRTDGFLLGIPTALSETLARIRSYSNAGANGIFVPCITNTNDIKEVVSATSLPVNVMCMPGLPDFEELQTLGVKRISMGGFFFNKIYDNVASLSKTVNNDKNFSSILS
jgi:2-methylisocitrate lyase-like PEP mutase family enzyme